MNVVAVRCQSYPGTYQFAAARLSGRESIHEGLTALPAWAGGAHSHSQFERAGCDFGRTIFDYPTSHGFCAVAGIRGGTGASRLVHVIPARPTRVVLPRTNSSGPLGRWSFPLRIQPRKQARCGFTNALRSFAVWLVHVAKHGEADVESIRNHVGAVRNVQC